MQINARKLLQLLVGLSLLAAGWWIKERGAATHAVEWVAAGWAMSALVLLRAALALRRGVKKVRQHTAAGINLQSADALVVDAMPGWLRGFYAMEKRAYRYSGRALTRQPMPESSRYGVANGPQGKMRTASLSLTVILCGAALATAVPRHFSTFWPLLGAATALLVAVLYALVWIVGGRRALREGGHLIADGQLLLDTGLRASAAIQLNNIDDCVAVGGHARSDGAWHMTLGEQANAALELTGVPFDATVLGSAQVLEARRVLLYVDDPVAFIAGVKHAVVMARRAARDAGAGQSAATRAGVD
jgi:hypothetical protein